MALLYFTDLSLIKSQCNIDASFTDDDTLLESIENAIVAHGQDLTGRWFVSDDRVLYLDAFPAGKVLLAPNLNSVASITYYTDAAAGQQTLDVAEYDVRTYPVTGFVRPARDYTWPDGAYDIEISYNAGYGSGAGETPLPFPIVQWMLINIATHYEHRENITIGTSANTIGIMPASYADALLDMYVVRVAA